MMTKHGALLQQNTPREALRTASAFFDEARGFFTDGILAQKPLKDLYLQVGGKAVSEAVDCHEDFARVLLGDKARDISRGPDSLYDPRRLGPLWVQFRVWAADNGLVASWHYCWDSAGTASWWQLRVHPGN